jgi:hypothetical protein
MNPETDTVTPSEEYAGGLVDTLVLKERVFRGAWNNDWRYRNNCLPMPAEDYLKRVVATGLVLMKGFSYLTEDDQRLWTGRAEDLIETPTPLPEDFSD